MIRRVLSIIAFCLLLTGCADEHPAEAALEELGAALADGDADTLAGLTMDGGGAGLVDYLPLGGELAPEGEAVYGESEASTPVRVPGRPRLVLEWRPTDDGWKVSVAETLEATRAAALNQALGGQ